MDGYDFYDFMTAGWGCTLKHYTRRELEFAIWVEFIAGCERSMVRHKVVLWWWSYIFLKLGVHREGW